MLFPELREKQALPAIKGFPSNGPHPATVLRTHSDRSPRPRGLGVEPPKEGAGTKALRTKTLGAPADPADYFFVQGRTEQDWESVLRERG